MNELASGPSGLGKDQSKERPVAMLCWGHKVVINNTIPPTQARIVTYDWRGKVAEVKIVDLPHSDRVSE